MENNNREIRDDEFRVLGNGAPFRHPDPAEERRRKRMGGWVAFAIVAFGSVEQHPFIYFQF